MAADESTLPPADRSMPNRGDMVPAPAVRRLSLYLRELEGLMRHQRDTISSKQLGEALGLTDAQVRKDLAYFGQFGHPGIGYRVDELVTRIKCILGTDRTWNAVVVGAGNLGHALVSYRGFLKKGFEIVAVFDNDPEKIGQVIPTGPRPLEVYPLERLAEITSRLEVQLAVLAVPADHAQRVADALVAAGVKGILNFAPATLVLPENVAVASVDLAVHLEQIAFRISASQLAGK